MRKEIWYNRPYEDADDFDEGEDFSKKPKQLNYKAVKKYYDKKLWTLEMVRNAVVKGWITAEEFEMITGISY